MNQTTLLTGSVEYADYTSAVGNESPQQRNLLPVGGNLQC